MIICDICKKEIKKLTTENHWNYPKISEICSACSKRIGTFTREVDEELLRQRNEKIEGFINKLFLEDS